MQKDLNMFYFSFGFSHFGILEITKVKFFYNLFQL